MRGVKKGDKMREKGWTTEEEGENYRGKIREKLKEKRKYGRLREGRFWQRAVSITEKIN